MKPIPENQPHAGADPKTGLGAALTIAALGVVFGDIGTSVLYAFKETLNPEYGIALASESIMGLLSLIF